MAAPPFRQSKRQPLLGGVGEITDAVAVDLGYGQFAVELKHVLAGGGIFGLIVYVMFEKWAWPTCRYPSDVRKGLRCHSVFGTVVGVSPDTVGFLTGLIGVPVAIGASAVAAAVVGAFVSDDGWKKFFFGGED
jgi:hypothetical protein